MNVELISTLASCTVALVIAIAAIIAKYCRNEKVKMAAEETAEICEVLLPYLEQAESYTNFSGAEKKAYVMTKMNQYAIDNGIPYDEELVDNILERYIELTKIVNAKSPPGEEIEENTREDVTEDNDADAADESNIMIVSLRSNNGKDA